MVEVEDFMKAKPDAIALSAARIISLMKAGGEKITKAFKSLCWRCKGIQVEVTHKNLLHQLIVKTTPRVGNVFHLTSSLFQFVVSYLKFINN